MPADGGDADPAGIPSSHFYLSQGQRLHYVDWGNADAPPLVLVHGRRDHCRAWDWVAADLRHDWHVMAIDLRGHGDSAWAIGGTYSFPAFLYDLAAFVRHIGDAPITLIGHSLGGNIALRYAAIFPEMVRRIVAIEGLGPAPELVRERAGTPMPVHMRAWLEARRGIASSPGHAYARIEDAVARMRVEHPYLTAAQARHLTEHGVIRLEDGRYGWRFDPLVRSFSPAEFGHSQPDDYWRAITAPTLLIQGETSGRSDPASDGRLRHFHHARVAPVQGAGHWVHHERLDELLRLTRDFLTET